MRSSPGLQVKDFVSKGMFSVDILSAGEKVLFAVTNLSDDGGL